MRDLFKARPVARVKAISDADEPGTFEALVSVFGNVDSDGEIVTSGAFTKTLSEGPKPIVYSHDWSSVPIGQTLEARETDEGLFVKGRLFVGEDEDHARAREVYAAMRAGALSEFSFGGRVVEETRREEADGSVVWLLNEIDLVEYGPCLKGANPATRLVAVKSAFVSPARKGDEIDVVLRELAGGTLSVDDARARLTAREPETPAEPEPQPEVAEEAEAAGDGTPSPETAEASTPDAPAETSPPGGGGDQEERAAIAAVLFA